MRRLYRRIRPDITGRALHAASLLACKALRLIERGHTRDEVRAWVNHPRRWNRYGPLAVGAVLTVLDGEW